MMDEMELGEIGSTFDSFLDEEGDACVVERLAAKRLLAASIAHEMEIQLLTRAELARRMQTSRTQVQRLLDPDNDSITLNTLQKAAAVVGKRVRIELV